MTEFYDLGNVTFMTNTKPNMTTEEHEAFWGGYEDGRWGEFYLNPHTMYTDLHNAYDAGYQAGLVAFDESCEENENV